MLRDFLIQDEFAIVPWTANKVSVDKSGLIRSLKENILEYRDENGDRCITANLYDGIRKYLVADVVAHSFKPVFIPTNYWNRISVMFLDGNKDNVYPGNLIWKFPIGLGADEHSGFAFIPGYSRYMVNREGTVINFIKNAKINVSIYNGYLRNAVVPDHNKTGTTTGHHRLISLAWLPYTADVDKLEINHINGTPGDDRLENLEWVTKSQNALHAHATGLHPGSVKVLSRNVITGEVIEYASHTECGNALDVTSGTILHRVSTPGQLVFTGNLQFKLKDDPAPWREIVNLELENPDRQLAIPIKTRNIFTNEVKHWRCAEEAGISEGIHAKAIRNKLSYQNNGLPCVHLDLKFESDTTAWPQWSNRELECFKLDNDLSRKHQHLKFKLVDVETNQETFYSYIKDAAKAAGVVVRCLQLSEKHGYLIRKKWKFYYL